MWPAGWSFPTGVDVHNSSAFQIVIKCTTHILLLATFIQTVYTASISWAKGYCGAVIHKSVQLVNSIKLPSTPRVALETPVNLLATTVKCLQIVNIVHQSQYSKASLNLRNTDLFQRHDITQQSLLPRHLWRLLFCRGCKERPLGAQLMCKHHTHTWTQSSVVVAKVLSLRMET